MELTINKAFAEQYEKKKKAEELSKLKDKYGSDIESESDSSSEEEDDMAVELTDQKRKDFLKTLSLVKEKDPRIYDNQVSLYSQDYEREGTVPSSSKPLYLRDYEREQLLKGREEGEEGEGEGGEVKEGINLLYNEEQKQLKRDLLSSVTDTEEELLTVRIKTKEEQDSEEADYIQWLKGQSVTIEQNDVIDMKHLQTEWTDPSIDSNEAFLRDYILNSMWIDKDKIPTYNEIVEEEEEEQLVSDDEETVEEQDMFERKYNFRFEEPEGATIISYPRNIPFTVRAKDEKRKDKRRAREEKKELEKQQKKEEIKRLKNLKKQEILAKLDKLKKLTGNNSVGFNEEDIEGDFNERDYDRVMERVFNNEYYDEEGGEKPVFSDDSDTEENWDEWNGEEREEEPHCEDPDFNMDADYDPDNEEGSGLSKRKRKRMSLFSRALRKSKPVFEPQEKSFQEYFDEYYKLDYEDLIGDVPCRFHYRSVVPNNFGLSTEEILTCEDRELNKWCSLKKAVQYRSEEEERRDVRKYRKKGKDSRKKKQILVSMRSEEKGRVVEEDTTDGKGRVVEEDTTDGKGRVVEEDTTDGKGKRKKRKRKKGLSESRLTAYGLTSDGREKKRKLK